MAWTAPMTAVANEVWTSAQWNTHVRSNLNETAAAKATTAGRHFVATGANAIAERQTLNHQVTTTETTTSTTYTDLTTTGPTVTITTGTQALVWIQSTLQHSVANNDVAVNFAVSGATTIGVQNEWTLNNDGITAGVHNRYGISALVTGLNAGSNTFTMKYRVVTAGTGTFSNREIVVMAL